MLHTFCTILPLPNETYYPLPLWSVDVIQVELLYHGRFFLQIYVWWHWTKILICKSFLNPMFYPDETLSTCIPRWTYLALMAVYFTFIRKYILTFYLIIYLSSKLCYYYMNVFWFAFHPHVFVFMTLTNVTLREIFKTVSSLNFQYSAWFVFCLPV